MTYVHRHTESEFRVPSGAIRFADKASDAVAFVFATGDESDPYGVALQPIEAGDRPFRSFADREARESFVRGFFERRRWQVRHAEDKAEPQATIRPARKVKAVEPDTFAGLAHYLKRVATTVDGRCTIPILTHVRVTATGDQVTLSATDLDHYVSCDLPAETHALDVAVPASALLDFVIKSAKNRPVRRPGDGTEFGLRFNEDPARLRVSAGRGQVDLPVLAAADLPSAPPVNGLAMTLDGDDLAAAVKDMKPVLMRTGRSQREGLNLTYDGDRVTMEANDGSRQVTRKLDALGGEPFGPVLIPIKAALQLANASGDVTMTVEAGDAPSLVCIRFDRFTITAKASEGYKAAVIPTAAGSIRVDRRQFLEALELAAVTASEGHGDRKRPVTLTLQDGDVLVTGGVADHHAYAFGETAVAAVASFGVNLDALVSAPFALAALKGLGKGDGPILLEPGEHPWSPLIVRLANMPDVWTAVASLREQPKALRERPLATFTVRPLHSAYIYRMHNEPAFAYELKVQRLLNAWEGRPEQYEYTFGDYAEFAAMYDLHVESMREFCDVEADPLFPACDVETDRLDHDARTAAHRRSQAEAVFESTDESTVPWSRRVFARDDKHDFGVHPAAPIRGSYNRSKGKREFAAKELARNAHAVPAPEPFRAARVAWTFTTVPTFDRVSDGSGVVIQAAHRFRLAA